MESVDKEEHPPIQSERMQKLNSLTEKVRNNLVASYERQAKYYGGGKMLSK